MITGKMIHEAYCLVDRFGEPWEKISHRAKVRYILMAQNLNVHQQISDADNIKYLFILPPQNVDDDHNIVLETNDLHELGTLVSIHTAKNDEFEVLIIQNGQKIGQGYYAVKPDKFLCETDSPYGAAHNLLEAINSKLRSKA